MENFTANLYDRRIVTSGQGMVRAKADEARVAIHLIAQEKRREPAVRLVSEEAARLKAQIDAVGYRTLETSGTSVEVQRDHSSKKYAWDQGPIIGYQVQQALTIVEDNLDRLEKLLGLLAGWESHASVSVQVSPAQWQLTFPAERDASAEACARAFADAQQRAQAVAKAAGFALSDLPSFIRQGSQVSPREGMYMSAMAAPRAMAVAAPPPVTLSPEEFEIRADVTVGWEIERSSEAESR